MRSAMKLVRAAGVLAAILTTAGIITPALAVTDLAFELDGDIAANRGGVDWASLFDSVGHEQSVLPPNFYGTSFVRDFVQNASGPDRTTFATGSKDTLNISSGWQCSRANNVSSKVDLLNSYATFYVDPGTGDDIVYFGLERSSNAGDGNVGIWFLQDPTVSCLAPATGPSTVSFTGDHFDGDLLVVAAFTTGGAVSTVNVYEWTGGNAAGHLNPTPIITGADCARSAPGDAVCAIVNSAAVIPPWPTQDKDGDNILNTSEFFEGGLNLTRMGLAFGCFNKVIFDTRSSQSLTATLFDFTLGTFLTCNDGNACTTDTCDPTRGCAFTPVACDDGNVCTTDTCDAAGGCVHTNNAAPCSDGNACTVGDVCSGGTCQPGTPRNCNDGNSCTDDSCNSATGCVHTNNTASCDDGNSCTLNDRCGGGVCVGGLAPNCDDGNVCTDDTCNPSTGCVHTANTAPCNDGNACTTNDTCSNGGCVGGPALSCDDGNVCTDDTCNPATGCFHTNNTAPCSDGNACTTNDRCSGGRCVGGPSPNCDDGNICTTDTCDQATGCVHTNNTAPCDDGNVCTTNDACRGGGCVGGPAPNCDDGNACTDDTCNPATGCVHTNNTAPCSDGNTCTVGDVCSGGRCVPGTTCGFVAGQ